MVEREKIFCNIELTKNDIFLFRLSTEILKSRNQDKTCFQKLDDTLQEKSKCSTDSTSVWQKAQDGETFFRL